MTAIITSESVETQLLERLRATGALLHGHFRLSSGLHSDRYIQCARLLEHPRHAQWAGEQLARLLVSQIAQIERVMAPALGGLIIGHEVARALDVPFSFCERTSNAQMALRRGFEVTPGERVVVVEDVITTGGSAGEAASLAGSLGADVVAVAAVVRRAANTDSIGGAPVYALCDVPAPTWSPDACPRCSIDGPPIAPGSRSDSFTTGPPRSKGLPTALVQATPAR